MFSCHKRVICICKKRGINKKKRAWLRAAIASICLLYGHYLLHCEKNETYTMDSFRNQAKILEQISSRRFPANTLVYWSTATQAKWAWWVTAYHASPNNFLFGSSSCWIIMVNKGIMRWKALTRFVWTSAILQRKQNERNSDENELFWKVKWKWKKTFY